MLVEIWSDIVCPFCYIGKKRFNQALRMFPHRQQVEVVWRSFQLNPEQRSHPGMHINDYLAKIKGWSPEEAKERHQHVTEMGKAHDIDFRFDKVVVGNSFDAHRLHHYADSQGRGKEMLARLFRGYFNEGRDIADRKVLSKLAADAGLDSNETLAVLQTDGFTREVAKDVTEARSLGIRGVPFFYINRRYSISGAQTPSEFLAAFEKVWSEQPRDNEVSEPLDGSTCGPEGECDE
jgi:predicted DsbA family dithiol-disulfide isomerase